MGSIQLQTIDIETRIKEYRNDFFIKGCQNQITKILSYAKPYITVALRNNLFRYFKSYWKMKYLIIILSLLFASCKEKKEVKKLNYYERGINRVYFKNGLYDATEVEKMLELFSESKLKCAFFDSISACVNDSTLSFSTIKKMDIKF